MSSSSDSQIMEAPSLQLLTHRLSECPPEFLVPVHEVHVGAVVWDLLRELGVEQHPVDMSFYHNGETSENHLRLVLVACWLLGAECFRTPLNFSGPAYYNSGPSDLAMAFLRDGLKPVAEVARAEEFVTDPDRREELVRLCLDALGLRPAGETEEYARDRLTTLSSVERARVLQATQMAQKRAEEIREAMRRKAAEEAAAKYARE